MDALMFPEGRVFDFLIVGVIALIVVGPKDLPILMRKVGQVVGKMRGMAAEFRASFDELARQSELEELRREVEAMRVGQQTAIAQFNPMGEARAVMTEINQHLAAPPAAALESSATAPGEATAAAHVPPPESPKPAGEAS